MTYRPEPAHRHDDAERTGVLLVNLGTPEAPTPSALRRYLGQFLSDGRVIEIPALLWRVILHGIILRVRPAKSAAKYAAIWTDEGSPLLAHTRRQARLLQGLLGEAGTQVAVEPAMRYGEPSIARALNTLKASGVQRLLVLPAYPQYAGATTASTFDEVARWGLTCRRLPELRFVNQYHDEPAYIEALTDSVRQHWQRHGVGELLVISFHGMPERTLRLGDPYHCQCHKTARLLATALGLGPDQYRVTFQSRFGRARWLEPATEPTLVKLARGGLARVDVICPGFSVDCLETLEEIDREARAAFLGAGGQVFHYIPCLNDSMPGMHALVAVAQKHLAGWPASLAADPGAPQRLARAKQLGAER